MPIDPKKLLAFVQRENGIQPEAPNPMGGGYTGNPAEPAIPAGAGEETDDMGEPAEGMMSAEEVEEIVEIVEGGEGDPMLMQLADELAAEIEEFGEDAQLPPTWAGNADLWAEAVMLLDPMGTGAAYTAPWAIVAHIYQSLGGTVDGASAPPVTPPEAPAPPALPEAPAI